MVTVDGSIDLRANSQGHGFVVTYVCVGQTIMIDFSTPE